MILDAILGIALNVRPIFAKKEAEATNPQVRC